MPTNCHAKVRAQRPERLKLFKRVSYCYEHGHNELQDAGLLVAVISTAARFSLEHIFGCLYKTLTRCKDSLLLALCLWTVPCIARIPARVRSQKMQHHVSATRSLHTLELLQSLYASQTTTGAAYRLWVSPDVLQPRFEHLHEQLIFRWSHESYLFYMLHTDGHSLPLSRFLCRPVTYRIPLGPFFDLLWRLPTPALFSQSIAAETSYSCSSSSSVDDKLCKNGQHDV